MTEFRTKAGKMVDFFSKLLGGFIVLFCSCNSMFIDEQKSNTAQNNFDLLWKIIDERYCFFEEKNVDWNEVYDRYSRALHENASHNPMYNEPDSPHLFSVMASMLEELRDGHVSLDDGAFSHSYIGWYFDQPENFELRRIGAYTGQNGMISDTETTFSILPESIGYIRCPTFMTKFNRIDLDEEISRFAGLKGVIIDIRSNGGGLISEAYLLASRFVGERTHVWYVRYKTGKGHNDFSDYYARYIEPDGNSQFTGKVVVLINRRVYSAANIFVSIMRCLPNVHIIGDRTGGGGGIPISAELYNGWTVKFSTNPVYNPEKRSIEHGIDPNQRASLATHNHIDNIIETAKSWILAQ